jgi:hypothetical protein
MTADIPRWKFSYSVTVTINDHEDDVVYYEQLLQTNHCLNAVSKGKAHTVQIQKSVPFTVDHESAEASEEGDDGKERAAASSVYETRYNYCELPNLLNYVTDIHCQHNAIIAKLKNKPTISFRALKEMAIVCR